MFLGLADSAREGAALFHCTAGKDRTGWAAASLLMLLGASESTIQADYLQTNEDLLPTIEPLLQSAAAKGVDPELLRQAFSVRIDYLDAALEQLESEFGTVENYFTSGLGLDAATIDTLRSRLTV
jgi:protein-tyrosine phosphatase